jgi:hypothetical protein
VKQAADAAGRRICFIGMSLTTYLEAAHREGRAPFDPKELVAQEDMDSVDPNKLLVVTTGSQVPAASARHLASRLAQTLQLDAAGICARLTALHTCCLLTPQPGILQAHCCHGLGQAVVTTGWVALAQALTIAHCPMEWPCRSNW